MIYEVLDLPASPLAASKRFHGDDLTAIETALSLVQAYLTLVFPAAGHEHRGWRLAAIQELARERAPTRVNGIEGGDSAAQMAACDFLERAPGVTGQLLSLDSTGVDPVSSS